jgi:hypothetical protein
LYLADEAIPVAERGGHSLDGLGDFVEQGDALGEVSYKSVHDSLLERDLWTARPANCGPSHLGCCYARLFVDVEGVEAFLAVKAPRRFQDRPAPCVRALVAIATRRRADAEDSPDRIRERRDADLVRGETPSEVFDFGGACCLVHFHRSFCCDAAVCSPTFKVSSPISEIDEVSENALRSYIFP